MNPLLPIALDAAVPLRIAEYVQQGGPGDEDFARVRRYAQTLAEKGDILQYGGKKGQAAELFNGLSDALAILAFCPGGVRFCGRHWESKA